MKKTNCKIDPRLTGCLFALLLFFSSAVYAQNSRIVKGLVVDSNNESIIGASVRIKEDATVGTITDVNGNFSISISNNNQTLVISYLGMITKEVKVAEKNQLTIVMQEDAKQLEGVIVVGYGKQKKESVVGSISQTNGDVLKRAGGVSNIGAALTGNVPGVITMQSTGKPGDEDPQILIRGQSTWNASSPLVLVDGIERPMNTVEISSVESISVLKDASATAVYGVKGANGVILITTKRGNEGKAVINVSANATMKSPSQLPNKLDSYNALNLRNRSIESEMALMPSAWNDYLPQDILNKYRNPTNLEEAERYPNVDWADVLFKDYAMSYDASVNVSGGTQFIKYFAGGEFLSEGDLFNSFENGRGYRSSYGYTRVNVRSNLDFQLTPTTVLSTNLSGVYGKKETPVIGLDEYAFWGAAYYTPSDAMLPQYSDGTFGYFPPDVSRAINSVEAIARSGQNFITTSRINTDFTLTQDLGFLLKGLSAKGTLSYDNEFVEVNRGIDDMYRDVQTKWIDPNTGEIRYQKEYDINTGFDFMSPLTWVTRGGNMDDGATYRKTFYQAQLNWARQFGKHDITAMGVFNREEYSRGSEIPHYREDWVFRTTYNYDKKYFVEFNGAYNGSEKFGPNYRFDFFPSVAAGYIISAEKFMKWAEPALDMFKLRASYGKIGDDNVNARWLYLTEWQYAMTAKMGPG
ncbi:MAG: SusC/RagA family TonB-linked outer membrane protein, partial [Dysgonamonadaceae bacterium]|nr:SusC/RagA family TonB-linked outer membrane protein [Dysgonamonadaceae bacterium]